jgi:hypothetical protein
MRKLFIFAITLSMLAVCTVQLSAQDAKDVGGHVFESATKRGVGNLEVKLTPPSNSNLAIRLTSTDGNGNFRFSQVRQGRYLLEDSQGPSLLYRGEIDAATVTNVEIPLQKR